MFITCPICGDCRDDKTIAPDVPCAICANCGFRHKFIRSPLFIITGASGVGKSTVCLGLAATMKDVVAMESDILARDKFSPTGTNHREYRETWLRVCKHISQAGKPVVLCGVGEPIEFEQCIERPYFSALHYLALICDDQILASRLRKRPAWRNPSRDKCVNEQVAFNRWLQNNARNTEPAMTLLDTSKLTADETVEEVERWIRSLLNEDE